MELTQIKEDKRKFSSKNDFESVQDAEVKKKILNLKLILNGINIHY